MGIEANSGRVYTDSFEKLYAKNRFNESKCNFLKVSSEPLRACLEGNNDIAMSKMLHDQHPDALSVSAVRQVASCALGLRWLAASVSRILV